MSEDEGELVLTLLIKNCLDNRILIDTRRIKSIIEDSKKVIDGELWIGYDRFGNVLLQEKDDS